MHLSIPSLLESYGYIVLFLLVGLESVGVPLPGETALLTAAALAALGHLSIGAVIATAAAGAIVGDNIGYWIGREGGLAFVRRVGRFVSLRESTLTRVRAFFDRHGAKAVFLGRFVALLRTWAAVLAGVGHMDYKAFMFYNALGGAVWSAIVGALGYLFGRNLPLLEHYVARTTWMVTLLVVLGVLGVVLWRRRRGHARQ